MDTAALYYNNTGAHNTAIGANALYYNTSGSYRMFAVGSYIPFLNTTGNITIPPLEANVHVVSNSTGNYRIPPPEGARDCIGTQQAATILQAVTAPFIIIYPDKIT